MSAEWTITGLTYDRDKAERRVDGNNPQVSCPVLFSAQCASFSCFMTSDINPKYGEVSYLGKIASIVSRYRRKGGS